ncbi:NYN domain-containing protein [Dietzia sp.]|uniref:NYN domain-containing protein n=1 Tax=Dietzia sp. TaxID=1871616 RepID=UPI002FD9AB95
MSAEEPKIGAAVVVYYQNVHLTAHELFAERGERKFETLIHPFHFARTLINARNAGQKAGYPDAELLQVVAFRRQPSSTHEPRQFGRPEAQRAAWCQSDPRVSVVYGPLRYRRAPDAPTACSTLSGYAEVRMEVMEKGIDVLCALQVLAQARKPDIGLVILASHDTDLVPALDAAIDEDAAKIETCQWYAPEVRHTKWLQPTGSRRTWNTRLFREQFESPRDPSIYWMQGR